MRDTRADGAVGLVSAARDSCADPPAGVASLARARFYRELEKAQKEFARHEAARGVTAARAALGAPVVRLPRRLRLVR